MMGYIYNVKPIYEDCKMIHEDDIRLSVPPRKIIQVIDEFTNQVVREFEEKPYCNHDEIKIHNCTAKDIIKALDNYKVIHIHKRGDYSELKKLPATNYCWFELKDNSGNECIIKTRRGITDYIKNVLDYLTISDYPYHCDKTWLEISRYLKNTLTDIGDRYDN